MYNNLYSGGEGMEHKKTYYSKELETASGPLIIEGPIPAEQLRSLHFHEGLVAFRPPSKQFKALIEIASLPEGRIIIARRNETIVGYATFLHPDPLERWSEIEMEDLIELGAIEVISSFRGASVGKNLILVAMMDEVMENYIVITTEYYWHWDLQGTGLNVWDYRTMMEKMMSVGGLIYYATDDPEICSHPVNCLMARIGESVPIESIEKFDQLRFINRFMY
jgi:acetoin utilization protein AcuA